MGKTLEGRNTDGAQRPSLEPMSWSVGPGRDGVHQQPFANCRALHHEKLKLPRLCFSLMEGPIGGRWYRPDR
jgi:hypothetical protein